VYVYEGYGDHWEFKDKWDGDAGLFGASIATMQNG